MWPKSFGLGIIQGWLWLFFLNGPLLYNSTTSFESRPEIVFMAFLLFTAVSYLLIAKMGKTVALLIKKPLILILSMSLMTAGTLIIGLEGKDLHLSIYNMLIFAGTLMSGLGSAVLLSLWGERYSTLPANQASLSFGAAVTVGTVIFFVLSRLPLSIAVVSTAFLPGFSLILLLREICTVTALDGGKTDRRPASFPFPGRLVVFIILFYLAGGLMYKMIAAGQPFGSYETYWLTNIIYFAVCLLAGRIIYTNPDLDLRLLYQPILPLLGVGFLLFPVLHTSYPVIPFSLLQAGFALFDLYTWVLFAYLAARYNFSFSIIAWGMFLITSAIFTGELLFAGLFSKIIVTMQETDLISLLAALLMFTGTMFFEGKRESFAGWDSTNQHDHVENSLVIEELACASNSLSFTIVQEDLPEDFARQYNLTPREKQIMLLLIEGRNNPYIRENLNISNNTLKTHLRNIYAKLAINDRQDLLNIFNDFKEDFSNKKTIRH